MTEIKKSAQQKTDKKDLTDDELELLPRDPICPRCKKNPKDGYEDLPGMCSECRDKDRGGDSDDEEDDDDEVEEWRGDIETELGTLSGIVGSNFNWVSGSPNCVLLQVEEMRVRIERRLDQIRKIAMQALETQVALENLADYVKERDEVDVARFRAGREAAVKAAVERESRKAKKPRT